MIRFTKIRSLFAIVLLVTMIISTVAMASCNINIFFGSSTTTNNGSGLNDPISDPIDDNYRTLYQIYVRSFADSDGNGKGDIRGIIETFDYLNDGDMANGDDLGVQAIWLTPVFSGNSAHKYDATDFFAIDPEFGTEEDLIELAELCEERNVKLILDLALNHTSTSNMWFKESKKAHINGDTSNKYYNYYSWSTSARTGYVKVSGYNLWYESWFDTQGGSMPELNYDNQAVRNEMLNVAKYWMERGVDGFRFDAVKYIYYEDHTKSSAFYKWYTDELRKEYPDIYLIGECWDNETNMLKYYNSMNCFNFSMAGNGTIASAAKGSGPISTFVDNICNLQQKIKNINPNGMISSFLSNHDQDRSAGFIATDNQRKMAASLYLLTPGTPVIYYGEEIGLKGSGDSPEDANRRLPFKWGDIWTCEIPNGATYNIDLWSNTADDQRKDENSLLSHYSDVLSVRHSYPAIARGTYTPVYGGKATFGGFEITYGDDKLILLHNTSATETVTVDLTTLAQLSEYSFFTILEVLGVSDASLSDSRTLSLGPQTSVILQ
ncbi:MAG: hypothetical protein E7312_08070 [Clostridiales bacterium]|nr:hypothetical protein [Clostridiales bacterium]